MRTREAESERAALDAQLHQLAALKTLLEQGTGNVQPVPTYLEAGRDSRGHDRLSRLSRT